jgi:hypothetical protein
MNENKTGKYFKYAIGEILLVVIGILIALQINNWNENQKTNRWEIRFLTDLQNELESDYEQLKLVYKMQTEKRHACNKVLELVNFLKEEDKSIIDLENIKNDSLKYHIMNLYNRHYNRLVYNGEVLDNVVGKVDWAQRVYFDESKGEINSWESIQKPEFSAQLRYLVNQNQVYTSIAKSNLEKMYNVIAMITNELNK